MSLTYSFEKARNLFDKMSREASVLEEDVSGDKAFNFVVTAYHLKDWIEKDSSVPQAARDDLRTIRADRHFQICRDLANASKHMVITRYQPSTAGASSSNGYGIGRFGKGAYGVGEESIEITHTDGSVINILQLKNEMMSLWTDFFSRHGI